MRPRRRETVSLQPRVERPHMRSTVAQKGCAGGCVVAGRERMKRPSAFLLNRSRTPEAAFEKRRDDSAGNDLRFE